MKDVLEQLKSLIIRMEAKRDELQEVIDDLNSRLEDIETEINDVSSSIEKLESLSENELDDVRQAVDDAIDEFNEI